MHSLTLVELRNTTNLLASKDPLAFQQIQAVTNPGLYAFDELIDRSDEAEAERFIIAHGLDPSYYAYETTEGIPNGDQEDELDLDDGSRDFSSRP